MHDTLLQGFQGLSLRLQTWAADLTLPASRRSEMEQTSEQARELLLQGRDRIIALRRSDIQRSGILKTIMAIGNDYAAIYSARFELSSEATEGALQTQSAEQILDIAREGLRNAFSHAHASVIRTTVVFDSKYFGLIIDDDGIGIDAATLQEGEKPGHWGLVGMRERARQLGAQLNIEQRTGGGTQVRLSVPGDIAYVRASRRWLRVFSP